MIQEILQVQYVLQIFLQPWLRIMNKFATIVAQNEQICKEEAPPPHVEPLLMWKLHMWRHHFVEAPHMLSNMVAQNANLRNHLANLFKFAMCGGGASSQEGGASS